VTSSNFLGSQFWKTAPSFQVKSGSSLLVESFALPVYQCTVSVLSCDLEEKMNNLSVEQKQTIKSLYKFERAKSKERKSLIFQNRKDKSKPDRKVRLMFTHTKSNPPIHSWVRQCKKLLARNDLAKDIGSRIQIGNRQPKNLQRIVGGCKGGPSDAQEPPPDAGCWKCAKCKVSCPIMKEGKTFKSTNTGKQYPIKQNLNCNTDWLIYLATCRNCQGQYVGKSKTKFKTRHSNKK
jgi:hypothetical protein